MRAGGCTVQQTLTPEAATIVKQAVNLARRRGHAQVTPLHVANTMLSSSTGLLRAACLQSHSHPLQCKALELCFNVALNRLPASSAPILSPHHHHYHHHHHPPSLSNALVAAFKRAQAHQRRGSIETQQQPLLAVKIELEQLVISILDDPSVSRVMREAGFSSPQVKSNVEQAVETSSTPTSPQNPSSDTPKARPPSDEDVMSVIDCLASRRKRSVVVVGECLATIDGVVRGVMDRVEKREVQGEGLGNLQFITLPLHSFRVMSREEVDVKVGELRCLVKSCCTVGRGAVLYLGDLQWAAEYRMGCVERGRCGYCPVEHVIMEIRSLLCGGMGREGGGGRFWLMGIATYHTYMRCKIGNPSLEALWGLQPLAVPSGSLELSLNCDSDPQIKFGSKQSGARSLVEDGAGNQLSCCADCSIKFENEVRRRLPNISSHGSTNSSLPSWLQNYKEESKRGTSDAQEHIQHLCKKWNSICYSSHKHQQHTSDMTLHFSSTSPSSSSISTYSQHHSSLHQTHPAWPIPVSTKQPWKEHHFWLSETISEGFEPSSRVYMQEDKGQILPTLPCINPNPNSTSPSHDSMEMVHSNKQFKELNAENLKILCNSLEREVPWQRDIIPEIASTILQCRSGMVRRKEISRLAEKKEEAWLFFLGGDVDSKEKIARKLASLVFGSRSSFISIGLCTFSSTCRSGSTDDQSRNKRSRSEASHSYLERFTDAIVDDPHRVILLEDIEQVDSYSLISIKNAIETGRIRSSNGEGHSICDAIVILCCESFDSRSRASSPPIKQKSDSEDAKDDQDSEKEINSSIYLDLNLSARDDDDMESCNSLDDVGLLESVDRAFFFRLPEDL